jgi:hypothetical protein
MSPRPLTLARSLFAITAICPFLLSPASAQTHKVAAPEKVTRALAVYEYTGELAKPDAARLIPVSLFIDNHLVDADVYLANPVPMALDTGIVYSLEHAGENIGTLDLDYARNIVTRRSVADDNPIGVWYGYGRFLSPAAEQALYKKSHPTPKSVIVASDDSTTADDKPRFLRRNASTSTAKPDTTSSTTASTTPEPDDDPDRPTLRHRDPATDAAKKKKPHDAGYVSGPSTSLNDDPDRPSLHRGIPKGSVTPSQLSGTPPNLHQTVAISDAATHEPHIFTREWSTSTERAETLTALEALAQPQVAAYLTANKLSTTSTPSATPRPNHLPAHRTHPLPKKPLAPTFTLTDEHLSSYNLTYGGLPTFLYTADVPIPSGGPVYVTLVVQRLPSGELQTAFASLTDASHLDRTPWFRPIDVVDPDGSHRASILFELRAQSSRQFALYQLISAKAEQTFITAILQ